VRIIESASGYVRAIRAGHGIGQDGSGFDFDQNRVTLSDVDVAGADLRQDSDRRKSEKGEEYQESHGGFSLERFVIVIPEDRHRG